MSEAVYIALPTYDGTVHAESLLRCGEATKRPAAVRTQTSSLLAHGFNRLWCEALNGRAEHGFRWFAMLHGDVIPDAGWVDTLIGEAEEHGADVMSAVVPLKEPSGLTSTAVENPDDPWIPRCRLTMRQVNAEGFPETFGSVSSIPGRLLVNTGCFVARLDREWSELVCFNIRDRIVRLPDGTFEPRVLSEDWQFSKDVADLGGKVMATTAVRVIHRGSADYDSRLTWGQELDPLANNRETP